MDLRPLVEHFLAKHQLLKPSWTPTVAADFLDALMQLALPGNARQLENLVRWVLVNKDDDAPLSLSDLPLEVWHQLSDAGKGRCAEPQAGDDRIDGRTSAPETLRQDIPVHFADLLAINDWNLSRSLQYCEKLLLEAALHKARGNQSQTARLLGITPRSVYNKLHKHQLHQ
jgi:two-component system nitrogen regulation response regulator GlnG